MSIRLAAPRARIPALLSRTHVRGFRSLHANDNGDIVGEKHLHAALRHFARHGLAAAQHAREQAIHAARAGDRQTFEWWLEICRALDRPMARKLDATCESAS